MNTLPLLIALVASPLHVPEGTILVLENSNPIVEAYTDSEVTHVAMVLQDAGQAYVYEAAPKVVRRLPLGDYLAELSQFNDGRRKSNQLRVRLYEPNRPYSEAEIAELKDFFESQLGRRYSVKGIVRKRQGDGIHCAQLVSNALVASGRYDIDQSYAVSPGELVGKITDHHKAPAAVELPPHVKAGSWCQRSRNWWSGVFTWCSWACVETWTFCR